MTTETTPYRFELQLANDPLALARCLQEFVRRGVHFEALDVASQGAVYRFSVHAPVEDPTARRLRLALAGLAAKVEVHPPVADACAEGPR